MFNAILKDYLNFRVIIKIRHGFPKPVEEDVDQKMTFTKVQETVAYIRPAKGRKLNVYYFFY